VTTALVTGASGGIGLEIARVLAGEHDDLVLVARSAEGLAAASAAVGGATVLALDLAAPGAVARVVDAVPDVDCLVNNAGLGDFAPFAEADPHKLDTLIALNIGALTQLTRAYLPGMLARKRGRILNVASTAAFQPGPLMAVYYATKAYVLSLSEALAEETRGSGVTVTALCPGPTASGFQAGAAMEGSRLVRGHTLPTAASVAAYGVAAMHKGDAVAVPGLMNKVFASSIRLTPRPIVRRVVHRMQSAGD
jgi:short-subunit dehydrogenase